MEHDDVVVVGGGIAGLVAATTAARAGATVRLLDARRAPGGRARSHEEAGFLCNEGPHALYRGGEAQEVFDRLGLQLSGGDPNRGTVAHGLRSDDSLVPLPAAPAALLRSRWLGLRGKVSLGRLLGGIGRVDPAPLAGVSMGAWLDDRISDPDARALVGAVTRVATYVADAESISADAAITQLQRGLSSGVRYIDGGWASIVDGLLGAARDAGVTIELGTSVQAVAPDGIGRWTVSTAAGPRRASAVVLAAGGPAHAASVAGHAAPVLHRWAEAAVPVTASHLDVGLPGGWTAMPVVFGLGRPLYLSLHAPVAARLAPAGGALVSTMRNHHAGESTDAADDRTELEALLERVRPGWRDDATVVRFGARRVVAHDRPTPERGGLVGRPAAEVPGTAGLYVAGDWVGPHGMLADAAASSGEAAGTQAATASAAAAGVASNHRQRAKMAP